MFAALSFFGTLAQSLLLWLVAIGAWALVKVWLLRLAGFDVGEVHLGVPVSNGELWKWRVGKTTFLITLLPVLALVRHPIDSDASWSRKLVYLLVSYSTPVVLILPLVFMLLCAVDYRNEQSPVEIISVEANSCFEGAGIRAGDRILELGGGPCFGVDQWRTAVASAAGTESVPVLLLHEGSLRKVTLPTLPVGASDGVEVKAARPARLLYATGLKSGSAADRAGMQDLDILLKIDGIDVRGDWNSVAVLASPTASQWTITLKRNEPNDRDGSKLVDVKLTRPAGDDALGVELYPTWNYWCTACRITGLAPGGAAEQAGIKEGDILERVDGKPFYSLYNCDDALRRAVGRETALTVRRSSGTQTIHFLPLLTVGSQVRFEANFDEYPPVPKRSPGRALRDALDFAAHSLGYPILFVAGRADDMIGEIGVRTPQVLVGTFDFQSSTFQSTIWELIKKLRSITCFEFVLSFVRIRRLFGPSCCAAALVMTIVAVAMIVAYRAEIYGTLFDHGLLPLNTIRWRV